ncbi:hypothetical protein T069G_06437 [Trichoderma breve]|uniref:Glutathione S-transferase n=1 Tax=Trichoderma breve TaxID=2034170 RepID=A0A9W9E5I5_9HYPO|nr:hypothetical protein T069G_06437 [Trichoderma breve]KAJ4858170.1 hypothetical protein T069G_06437 [Trichoderma breve]
MPTPTDAPLALFWSPGACSFVPHVALCEAGIKFDLVLAKIGQMTKEFEEMNPKRRVPVLVMGSEVITEMAAVLTAIATIAPEAHILGKTPLEKIRVYEWLNYLSTTAHGQAIAEIWRTERFTNNKEIYPQLRAKGYETMREIFAHIEAKFKESNITEFAVGKCYTAADGFLSVLYLWTARFTEVTIDIDNDYPVYAAYVKKMLQRTAFIEARRIHKL